MSNKIDPKGRVVRDQKEMVLNCSPRAARLVTADNSIRWEIKLQGESLWIMVLLNVDVRKSKLTKQHSLVIIKVI
ncbi:hypothetical protein ElyMa_006322400 [Elysia marginata]|uniref:Uncharacterized protein n=1 Tax=Elysia marginata TaxID=1093978 RepID=A0AAV4HKR4_9GAST|nr:hypothetical protein ElyMa_006322400 [Elysia marginata]